MVETYNQIFRASRNQGIFGQKKFMIKNKNYIWILENIDTKLWGRCSIDEGHSWLDWQELVSDYNGFFSFTICDENKLHIICKNSKGHIQYCCWQGEKIAGDLLGDKWVEEERVIYQTIFIDNRGNIHLLYFTENPIEEFWRIKYCFKGDGQWNLPEVIDYGFGYCQNHGTVALGSAGTIYLIYQTFRNNNYQLVYRERYPNTNQWSDKATITTPTKSNMSPSLDIDEKGNLHLTWLWLDGMNLRVMYRRNSRGGWLVGGWQKSQCLSLPEVNCCSPIIGVLENRIEVIWWQKDGIYQCISYDKGQSFSEPILHQKYQKLANKSGFLIDLNKKQGLDLAAFDIGSIFDASLSTGFKGIENEEKTEIIQSLHKELSEKEEQLVKQMKKVKILEKFVQKANKKLAKNNKAYRSKKSILEKNFKAIELENEKLRQKLAENEVNKS